MGNIQAVHGLGLTGEVNSKPPHEIGPNEAASAVNLDPRSYYGVTTRPGRATFSTANGSGTGTKGLFAWTRDNGTSFLVYRTGTTFWHASAAGFASIGIGGTDSEKMQASPLNDILAIVVAGLAPRKWDGTTFAALGGTPPTLAKYAAVYSSKLFLAGDTANPQTMSFSATNNPENFTLANDAGSITSQDGGGDTIQGFRACRKWLCVFYRYYTEILIGNSVFNFAVERLKDVGLVSQTGHAGTGEVAFFASDEAIWMVAGARASDITTSKIREWYRAIADKTKITLSVKGNLLLVIDYGTGTCYACDYLRLNWTNWSDQYWEVTSLANDQTLYAGPSASTEQLQKIDSGTADNASAIAAYWRTGNHAFGWPDCVKNDAGLHLLAKPGMPTTTITFYKNGASLATTKALTFANTGDSDWAKSGKRNDVRAAFLAYKFAWSGVGTLFGFAAYAEVTSDPGEVPTEV